MRAAVSLNSVESFLKNFEIAGVAHFFARLLDPFFLQRILRRAIGFVKDSEHTGEWKRGEFVCGEFVGDVVPQLVLGRVVPFSLLDQFEAAALLRVGGIEHVREKFDAFAQAFDNAEALVIHGALDHLDHVRYCAACVRAMNVAPPAINFFIGLTG